MPLAPELRDGIWHTYRWTEIVLYNVDKGDRLSLGTFYAEEQFTGDIRCDLHPRWSHDGKIISFDSVHEGSRQIYTIDVSDIERG